MRKSIVRIGAIAAAVTLATGLSACSSDSSDSDTVTLDFFQSKSEAIDTFDEIIAAFEAENPGITVNQINSPDAMTDLKARLAKNQIPDVIAVNASNYADVIDAGILSDQSGTTAFSSVSDTTALAYDKTVGNTDDTYALPLATNAQVVLYNKDIYDELGLEIPTTWDEFIANAAAVQDAGQNAFEFTWKDSWTAKMLLNSVAGGLQGDDFTERLASGETTFSTDPAYRETAEKMLELKKYSQPDPSGTTYNDGNTAFANGESAMYVQGVWAISEIQKVNPDINLGVFVMPTSDDPDETVVISGSDSIVGVSESSKHAEAAQAFVDYLLDVDAQTTFSEEQNLFSVRSDVPSTNELLTELKSDYIDEGRTAAYPDAAFSGSSDLSAIVQVFLADGDIDAFLADVDADWQSNGVK